MILINHGHTTLGKPIFLFRDELEKRGLSKAGKKDELIQRLESYLEVSITRVYIEVGKYFNKYYLLFPISRSFSQFIEKKTQENTDFFHWIEGGGFFMKIYTTAAKVACFTLSH